MSMPFSIRLATPQDAQQVAHLIFLAGEPVFRYLFFEDPDSCEELLCRFFCDENNVFTYHNAFVAVDSSEQIAGLVYAVDFDTQTKNERAMPFLFPKHFGIIRTVWRLPRFLQFAQFASPAHPSEYFINHLAVHEAFRGQGLAIQLLQFAEQEAQRKNIPYLGLYVDFDNERARTIYEQFGFQTIQSIECNVRAESVSIRGQYRMRKILDPSFQSSEKNSTPPQES